MGSAMEYNLEQLQKVHTCLFYMYHENIYIRLKHNCFERTAYTVYLINNILKPWMDTLVLSIRFEEGICPATAPVREQ